MSASISLAQAAGSGSASVIGIDGTSIGRATFTPAAGGVQVTARFQGLTPGMHGIHVHTTGQCDPPDFMTAGGHFNPNGRQHGLDNPEGAHVGDLPNLQVGSNGTATFNATLMGATLNFGPTSLFKPGGTALVIHADPDDEVTDPTGNSGSRIACGLIVAGAQAAAPAQVPRGLPNTGDLAALPAVLGALGGVSLASGLWFRRRYRR